MTSREARKHVLRSAAASLPGDIDVGAGWIFEPASEELSDADKKRMVDAVNNLADHLDWLANGKPVKT